MWVSVNTFNDDIFGFALGSSIKYVSRPSAVRSGRLINFIKSFMYDPTPPAFVFELLLIKLYPAGMVILFKLFSVSLVSDIVIIL